MIIDTHTHLYLPEFDSDGGGEAAVNRAVEAGIGFMIFPNVDSTTIAPMKRLHAAFPTVTAMAMGLHPTEIGADWRERLEEIHDEFSGGTDYVAVGEIGVDLYWDRTFAEQQMMAFEQQLSWAAETSLPVIIHCRDAQDEVLEVLQTFPGMRGVMHSFGGTPEDVERVRKVADMYFGINGIVTFKNSRLRDSLPAIGLDRMLVETDSPYLAPVPYRGKRNESAYIVNTVEHIARHLDKTPEAIAAATASNAISLFNLPI